MFIDFFKNFNWIDLLLVAILVRAVFVGTRTGVVTELLKFLGLLLTLFICFHYYASFAQFLMAITNAPWPSVMEVLAFLILWGALFFLCKLIREGVLLLFTIEANTIIDKWGGIALSVARFFVLGSMTLFVFLLIGSKYFDARVKGSFSSKYVIHVAPNFYATVCDSFVTKIFPSERSSKAVREQLKKVESR